MDRKPTVAASPSALARALYQERRARDRLFEPGLFGEPAWDILLDLYALEREGKAASLAMLAAGASIPPETARRFVGHLVAAGYVSHDPPEAAGSVFLRLTDDGHLRMRIALREILKRRTG